MTACAPSSNQKTTSEVYGNSNLIQSNQARNLPLNQIGTIEFLTDSIMKRIILLAAALHLASLCSSSAATDDSRSKKQNILLICVDDLRPELKSFGVDYIHSPNIDRLAASGRVFHNHYVNAPTCGASRYTMLTGQYGSYGNQALFARAEKLDSPDASVPPSMPEWFRKNGYKTVSVGKVSHHPGGWGGEDWYDNNVLEMPGAWDRQLMPTGQWKHPRGAMHSLAHGEIKPIGSFSENKIDAFQSAGDKDTDQHDGLIANEGLEQLEYLAGSDKPFFLAIGLIKPHLPFGSPKRYMEPYEGIDLPPIPHPEKPSGQTTWHGSGEFMSQYLHYGQDPREDAAYADEVRRHYAACVSYVDHHVGEILAKLKETGRDKDTIVVLWGDHGWHLGEQSIWGKHSLFEESLRSPLIISVPGMENPGKKSNAVIETVDLFPTLCELTGLDQPDFAHGASLLPQIKKPNAKGHTAYAYNGKAQTLRTERYRFTLHKDGYAELYDHDSPKKEAQNIAQQFPRKVEELKQALLQRASN
jgi:iduronate 2-sulfatase